MKLLKKKNKEEILQMSGEIQLMRRKWYELYKKDWHKHVDFWGKRWWVRYNWPQDAVSIRAYLIKKYSEL